ncbi:MAG: VCBS repeat-containing protein [Deltaproteobacteria bacterium]|nr:VCBS repeat-containing protein [Deltaproteobacteria bacterium]
MGCSDLPAEAIGSGAASSSGSDSSTAASPPTTEPSDSALDDTTTSDSGAASTTPGPATDSSSSTGPNEDSSSGDTGPRPTEACNDGIVTSGELCHVLGPAIAVSPAPDSVATGDLDQDGATDVVLGSEDVPELQVLWGVGNGNLVAPQLLHTAEATVHDLVVEDFSNDGWPDLVFTDSAGSRLVSYANDGTGGLFFAGNYPTDLAPIHITVGNIDGDGIPDVIASANVAATVLHGNGLAGFIVEQALVLTNGNNWLSLQDLDLDLQRDLIAVNQSGNDVSTFANIGGMFDVATDHSTSAGPIEITAGDVDQDGFLDIALLHTNPPTVGLLRGDGSGGFMSEETTSVGPSPVDIELTDLDGDGILDLAVLHGSGDQLALYRGQGNGMFAMGPGFALEAPSSMHVTELNGDGVPDLLILRNADSVVQVLLSDP